LRLLQVVGKRVAVPGEIFELVERFERNREACRSGCYNETQLLVTLPTRSWRFLVRRFITDRAIPKPTGTLYTRIRVVNLKTG